MAETHLKSAPGGAPEPVPGTALGGRTSWRHRRRLGALALVVAIIHFWLTDEIAELLPTPGAADEPARLQAVYARQIQLEAPPPPPAVPPAPAPQPNRPAPRPARPAPAPAPAAASAPAESLAQAASEPASAPEEDRLAALPPTASAASEPSDAASSAIAASAPDAAASGPAAEPFVWPPSTRLSYTLKGEYRGELHGSAQVEWINAGERYQVHIDVLVGPSFAPLLRRSMSSDGLITPQGLEPLRYDESTRFGFKTRRNQMQFSPASILLSTGKEIPTPAGVQDTASQFVQLSYRFIRDPSLLRAGQAIPIPLALPRRLYLWVYDVLSEETLHTPFGEVPTYHLKPRRPDKPQDTLEAEIWFAPTLQYLPVRILIRQVDGAYIDMMIETLPEQALPASGASGSPP